MTELEKAARMALEALEELQGVCTDSPGGVEAVTIWTPDAIAALTQALAMEGRNSKTSMPDVSTPDKAHAFLHHHGFVNADGSLTEAYGGRSSMPAPQQATSEPIPMVLHCPRCGAQHIDGVDSRAPGWHIGDKALTPYGVGTISRISRGVGFTEVFFADLKLPAGVFAVNERYLKWPNEPHRSHLCHGCGTIWRPADVPTTGVAAINTKGKADTWAPGPITTPECKGEPVAWIRKTDITELVDSEPESDGWQPLYTSSQVPEGYALVPVEPTPEMCRAGAEAIDGRKQGRAQHCYAAMLDAARKGE